MPECGVSRDLVISILSCKMHRFANIRCSSRLIFAPIWRRAGKHFDEFTWRKNVNFNSNIVLRQASQAVFALEVARCTQLIELYLNVLKFMKVWRLCILYWSWPNAHWSGEETLSIPVAERQRWKSLFSSTCRELTFFLHLGLFHKDWWELMRASLF